MMLRPLFTAFLLIVLLLAAGAGTAFAHAGLIATDPPAGSILPVAPPSMTLTFTEPVSPIGVSLIGVGGAPQALTWEQPDGPLVKVVLPADLADGSYLLSWRVTSADGHPVNGTVDFAVGAVSGVVAAPDTDPWLDVAIWLVRVGQYVALFLGVGSLAIGAAIPLPDRLQRGARGLAAGGLVLVPVALALHGLDLLGAAPPALFTAAPWAEATASPYALTEAALALAFVVALLPGRWSGVVAALVGVVAPTLSGHAVTAPPQALLRAVLAVHIASLLAWLGALVPLLTVLRHGDTALLAKFSRWAPFAIAGLLGSGLGLALVQMGPPSKDWLSPYGLLLGAKLALVALLLGLALWNRVRLTDQAAAGNTRPLRRSIAIELALAVAILGIVAGWRFTPPPRVLAEIVAAQAPAVATLTGSGGTATLTATPGTAGTVVLAATLPVEARSVTVRLANAGYGISTISRPATLGADGRWTVASLVLPAGGDWQAEVEARIGDFDLTTFGGTLPLRGEGTAVLPAVPTVPTACPTGQTFTAGALTVSGAFTRATPKGAQSAGAYFIIANAGATPDTLVSATTGAASNATLHAMRMDGNIMTMAPIEGGLAIPAGGSAVLAPAGDHLMLTGLAQPFVEGQCLTMTLHFATAGDLTIELNIGGFGQSGPPAGGSAQPVLMDHMMM